MANNCQPRVFIGMPVYNGEKHIRETIDSILSQTFTDFQLLISDNGSTDQTGEICREYAERDERVVYCRQKENLGMAGNFNYVVQPNGADYFKWAAHDDTLEPDYLLKCVELLDSNPSLAMAHCLTNRISDDSTWLEIYKDLGLSSSRVSERFWRVLWTVNIYEIYGVIRSEAIEKTRPVGTFFGSERNRLAEVLLQGDIGYLKEALFSRRDHESSLTALHLDSKENDNFTAMQEAHAPKAKMSSIQVAVLKLNEYFESIFRFPMPWSERISCVGILLEWSVRRLLEGSSEKYRVKLYSTAESMMKIPEPSKLSA
ncbi:glycosyltransferase family A protein [Pseudanabaena sp. FACHB-2040]|uniref:glycosyltransferase family 2 protein n=1 Tax=Pseudanabaena sp. FACHB-2040 TaxID=2692859 RepID=UPI00168339C2|nr:glycosyltransferase family A protein [Pseudanabaena sp. FACHB-2040]MBD2257601.1 glycosyltransferase family 2 protein [Pseudanabaena sp. FACHB-2040]